MQRPSAAVVIYEPLWESTNCSSSPSTGAVEYMQLLLQLTCALFHTVARCGHGFPQLMIIEVAPSGSGGSGLSSRIVYSSRDVEQRTCSIPAVVRRLKDAFLVLQTQGTAAQRTSSRCAVLRALLQGSCFLSALGLEEGLGVGSGSLCVVLSPSEPRLVVGSAVPTQPLPEADQAVVSSLAHTWSCQGLATTRLCVGGRLAGLRSLNVLTTLIGGTIQLSCDEAVQNALGLIPPHAGPGFSTNGAAGGLGASASLSSGQVMVCPKCLCWAPWPSDQQQCTRCGSASVNDRSIHS